MELYGLNRLPLLGWFLFFVVIVSSLGGSSAAAPDREARHEVRLEGLDLASRANRATASPTALSFDDTRISGSIAPARFTQELPAILNLADSSWLVVWQDERHGSRKIFWQHLDALGVPIGINELMAGAADGANYVDPHLAMDTLGRVYLYYRDQTHGMLYGSRYTASLVLEMGPFLVNDTSFSSFAGPYDMAVFPDGQTVVVWESYSALGNTIKMRIYTPSGATLGAPQTVNSDGGSAQHWVPAVAVAPGSGFLVVWEDYRLGRADIFGRRFAGDGTAIGADFTFVPPPSDVLDQYAPAVTFSPIDDYVVGWVDRREGQEVYLQRFDPDLGLVDQNVLVSSGDSLSANWDVDLAARVDGEIVASWAAFGAENSILGMVLDSGLSTGVAQTIMNVNTVGQRWGSNGAGNELGQVALCWSEIDNDDPDIHLMIFDRSLGRELLNEVRVNDDVIGAPSTDPVIVATSDWYHLIAYTDTRYDAGDILVQAIGKTGIRSSVGERKANQDVGGHLQSQSALASFGNRALVVWIDSRSVMGATGQRIYGRFGNEVGEFAEDEFMISDTSAAAVKADPMVVIQSDGSAVVAWIDRRDGTAQVYARGIDNAGVAETAELAVSDGSNISATNLSLAKDNADNVYLIWLDIGGASPIVRGQWFGSDLTGGGSFSWTTSIVGEVMEEIAAGVSPISRELNVFWVGRQVGVTTGWINRLTADGIRIGSTVAVTDQPSAAPTDLAISISESGMIATAWVDRRMGKRLVYRQIMDGSLVLVDNNQPASSASPEFMDSPTVSASLGRAWFAWSDPRETGLTIWASSMVFDPTGVGDNLGGTIPAGYTLSQNYPNPFNPSTMISYSIPEQSIVRLDILNVLGQTVATLVDQSQFAGTHSVSWNGRDDTGARVASGVYLYRLSAGDVSQSKKMLLLK